MNRVIVKERVDRIIYECDRHLLRIDEAMEDLVEFMPLDAEKYITLTKDEVQALDQFLFRFSKLQDAVGQKLFKQILILHQDDNLLVENMPFLDILNKLERVGVLDVESWRRLRDSRNELAHNYDDEPNEMAEAINKIYREKDKLVEIYFRLKDFYNKMF